MTTYIVLQRFREPGAEKDVWEVWEASVEAPTAEAAVRAVCRDATHPAGTYVAVPARSWKPVTVEAVQTTVLKLS